jgi:hypothetical protein
MASLCEAFRAVLDIHNTCPSFAAVAASSPVSSPSDVALVPHQIQSSSIFHPSPVFGLQTCSGIGRLEWITLCGPLKFASPNCTEYCTVQYCSMEPYCGLWT